MIKTKPSLILGCIVLGLLMMWVGSSIDLINSVKVLLLFGGTLLVMAACGYCGYQLYKVISNKF